MRLLCLGVFIQLESRMEIVEKPALEGRAMYISHFPNTSLPNPFPAFLIIAALRHRLLCDPRLRHPLSDASVCLILVIRESKRRAICAASLPDSPHSISDEIISQKGIRVT